LARTIIGLIEKDKDGKLYCPYCGEFVQYTIEWLEKNTVGVLPVSKSTVIMRFKIDDGSEEGLIDKKK